MNATKILNRPHCALCYKLCGTMLLLSFESSILKISGRPAHPACIRRAMKRRAS